MAGYVRKLIFMLLLVIAAGGCETLDSMARSRLDFINYTALGYAAKPKDYPVDLFFEGKPGKEYETIGEITGSVYEGSQVRQLLEIRVRQVGADGAIDIVTKSKTKKETDIVDVRETDSRGHERTVPVAKTRYYDVIKITAKAIKYKE